jgi:RNA polymerase sigma-70 factor, ECF subfamily
MVPTSASLLDRLHDAADNSAWRRMVDLYDPVIRGYLRRRGLASGDDADDVVQEVLAVVCRRVRDFDHNQRPGAFRAWLRTITVNCLRDHWRSGKTRPVALGGDGTDMLDQLADPDSGLSQEWDDEHDLHVVRRLMQLLESEFKPDSWQAFRRAALEKVPVDQVAAELGMTPNAVYIAKSRILQRLRQEAAGLVELDDQS